MMGHIVEKVSIPKILQAIGVAEVVTVSPLKLDEAVKTAVSYTHL